MTSATNPTTVAVRLSRLGRRAARLVQGVAFWVGALFPLVYVPALLFGFGNLADVFLPLVAANAVAFVVGHGHDPAGGSP